MTLENFKGQKSFTFEPDGHDASIFGANGLGKTTIADAWRWLLFNKDTTNRTAFSIKTIDQTTGESIHFLEHSVEAVLDVDGKELILKKMLKEDWVKKRGEAEKQFKGHSISYWIDEVPCTKALEFTSKVNELINEDLFKLITDPLYFSTQLSWQDRRKILLEIAGDVSDEQVIASDAKLAKLTGILNGKSTDDYKKILAEKIKKLNKQIEEIPIKINELNRGLEGEEPDYTFTEKSLKMYKDELADLEEQLVSASAIGDEFRKKQAKVSKLYQELNTKKAEIAKEANAGRDKLQSELNTHQRSLSNLNNDIYTLELRIKNTNTEIEEGKTKADSLRADWKEENAKVFVEPDENSLICPTCGQGFTSEQRLEIFDTSKAKFEADKKSKLSKITADGKKIASGNTENQKGIENLQTELGENNKAKKAIGLLIESIQKQLDVPQQAIDVDNHPDIVSLKVQINALEDELQAPTEDRTSKILDRKKDVMQGIEDDNVILNNKENRAKTLARIKELEDEERDLAKLMSELEGHKYLIEQFIISKVNLLEDSINSMFTGITFKMFKVNINGGVEEVCEALVDGVPYSDANNAGKINGGLSIISTLCKHYGVSAPVFVDNAEAVVDLMYIDSQVIRLVVSEADKTLRVGA